MSATCHPSPPLVTSFHPIIVMTQESPLPPTNLQQTPETTPEPTFGFSTYAEQINGRFAMVGFILLLLIEAVTHQDIITWLGLR